MPCALCGDIIPTEVIRCPACGAWAHRRDFRALGVAVFMLLGFDAFVALGSGISLTRLTGRLRTATTDSFDPVAAGRWLAPYRAAFQTSALLALLIGTLFVAWLWLAYRQTPPPRRYQRGWVIGGWLLPGANLWLPPRLVYETWVNSARFRTVERQAIGTIVTAWWTGLLVAVGLLWVFPRSGTDTIAQARFSLRLGIAATMTEALAAIAAMMIVFRITRLQIDRPA